MACPSKKTPESLVLLHLMERKIQALPHLMGKPVFSSQSSQVVGGPDVSFPYLDLLANRCMTGAWLSYVYRWPYLCVSSAKIRPLCCCSVPWQSRWILIARWTGWPRQSFKHVWLHVVGVQVIGVSSAKTRFVVVGGRGFTATRRFCIPKRVVKPHDDRDGYGAHWCLCSFKPWLWLEGSFSIHFDDRRLCLK